jgi:hypothetical protein
LYCVNVAVPDNDGALLTVYGVDTTSHKTVWSYPLSGRLALSQNGVLYIEGAAPLAAINVKQRRHVQRGALRILRSWRARP